MAPSLISLHKLATGYATDLALLAGADVTNLQSHQLAQLVEFAATLRADELAALLRVAEAIFGHR